VVTLLKRIRQSMIETLPGTDSCPPASCIQFCCDVPSTIGLSFVVLTDEGSVDPLFDPFVKFAVGSFMRVSVHRSIPACGRSGQLVLCCYYVKPF
jgi:hypothetical protein